MRRRRRVRSVGGSGEPKGAAAVDPGHSGGRDGSGSDAEERWSGEEPWWILGAAMQVSGVRSPGLGQRWRRRGREAVAAATEEEKEIEILAA